MKIYQEAEFKILKEENRVVCIITATFVPTIFGKPAENLKTTIKAVGRAKCHPDDEFDVTMGKRIAETRASIRVYDKALKYAKKLVDRSAKITKDLEVSNYKVVILKEINEQHDFELTELNKRY